MKRRHGIFSTLWHRILGHEISVVAAVTKCTANRPSVLEYALDVHVEYSYEINKITYHGKAHIVRPHRGSRLAPRDLVKAVIQNPSISIRCRQRWPRRSWLPPSTIEQIIGPDGVLSKEPNRRV